MAFDDSLQKNQDQNTMNVVQPNVQGQQAPQGPEMPQNEAGGAAPSPSGPQAQEAGNVPNVAQNRGGQPSSGMYTNLKSYMQANQGAGQQLGQAAQRQSTSQADEIRQQVEKAQRGFSGQIDQQTGQLGQTRDFAKETAQRVAGTTDQTQAEPFDFNQFTQSDDFNRFRDVATGRTTFGEDMRAEDFAAQNQLAGRLDQQVQGLRSQEGRADALRNAFRDREYTRGQSNLDNLILQSDANAVRDVIQGGQSAAEQARTGIQDAREQSIDQLSGLREESRALSGDVLGFTGEQDAAAEQRALQSASQERQAIIDQMLGEGATGEQVDQFLRQSGMELDPLTQAGTVASRLGQGLQGTLVGKLQSQAASDAIGKFGGQRGESINEIYDREFLDRGLDQRQIGTGGTARRQAESADELQSLKNAMRTDGDTTQLGQIRDYRNPVINALSSGVLGGVNQNALGLLGQSLKAEDLVKDAGIQGQVRTDVFDIADRMGGLQSQLTAQRDMPQFLQEVLSREQGLSQDDTSRIFDAQQIQRSDVDDTQERARLNALTALMEGRDSQNLITGQGGAGADTSRLQAFNQDLLKRIGR